MISTSGDTHLGGEDFDHRVMDYFMKLIKKKYKVDISKDSRALQKLRREAERAKRALSSQHQARALAGFPDPLLHPVTWPGRALSIPSAPMTGPRPSVSFWGTCPGPSPAERPSPPTHDLPVCGPGHVSHRHMILILRAGCLLELTPTHTRRCAWRSSRWRRAWT